MLDGHCETEGRDPAEIQRTVIGGDNPLDDVDGFLRRMEALAALGIDQVWTGPDAADPVGSVSRAVRATCSPGSPRSADAPLASGP